VLYVMSATRTTVDQYWTTAIVTHVRLTQELMCITCLTHPSYLQLSCSWR